ncbi:MAG: sugar ABC transporter substrate-binding protein [Candidatus Dormibacteraeota bacterium]|nr:sugar ABC transporter substrate-binding protein [Candidatus Dormibacteraeota bacterium]
MAAETERKASGARLTRKQFLARAAQLAGGAAAAAVVGPALPSLGAEKPYGASGPTLWLRGKQVTLTYYFGANAQEAHVRQKLFNKFMAKNPDIKIVNQLDGTQHLQKFNTELAGGNAPDLMMSWELDYSAYAKRGVYMDLHKFIKNDEEFQNTVMPQEYPAVLKMFSDNGKLYVLPEQVTDVVLFYNKAHVKEAGLKMPTSWDDKTWTWDKFLSYAKKLTKKSGSRVSQYGYADMWGFPLTSCNVIATANGGTWFTQPVFPTPGSSNLSSPQISNAIQWYADLTNVHHVSAPSSALTSQPGNQLFQTGQASMGIVGHWFYPAFSTTHGLEFDIAPIPIGPDGGAHSRTNIGGTGISISAKTKYPEQCWRFVKYWAGMQGQRTIAKDGLWVPALKNVGESSAYNSSNGAMKHAQVFTEVLREGNVYSLPISPAWPDFSIPWGNVLTNVWQGKASAKSVLHGLDHQINADLQKFAG